jgi:2-phosphosulfolactate phosphatase
LDGGKSMKIDVIISADDIKYDKIHDNSVVVIDMLRATSVIITAIYNKCKGVIPVLTVKEAFEIAKDREKYILGGERNAVIIENFDFSNSPLEYTENAVKDKTLVMTTTNGTKAIKNSNGAKNIIIAAMINAKYAAKRLVELNNDIVLVNAGTKGQFSMDDFICSGYIIENILKERGNIELTDIAKTAKYIYEKNTDIFSFIKHARHYEVMKGLNLEDDIKYCCQKDIINIVPEYKDSIIM